jgi:hypothetical protein
MANLLISRCPDSEPLFDKMVTPEQRSAMLLCRPENASPGDKILVASYGTERCTAFQATDKIRNIK